MNRDERLLDLEWCFGPQEFHEVRMFNSIMQLLANEDERWQIHLPYLQ